MPTATKATVKNEKRFIPVQMEKMTGGIKKAALVGVGAVAVASDKVSDQVKTRVDSVKGRIDELADRGDKTSEKGRQKFRDLIGRGSDQFKKGAKDVSGRLNGQVSNVLGKLNVPTKSDIVELTRRIDSLSRKIDKL